MKLLSIGTDRKLFEKDSAISLRTIEYGQKIGEIHIIVFTPKSYKLEAISYQLSPNVFVYPTNSSSRWLYIFDAVVLGKKIIVDKKFVRGDSVVTCQDPFECGYVGWRISSAFRLPLHLQVHTDFLSPYFKTSFLQRFRVWLGTFLLPKAVGVRVVSKRIADSLTQAHIQIQHPVQVLPIRIDVERIIQFPKIDVRSLVPKFKFTILMASRLTEEKNISDALCALKKVHEIYPFAGLLIVGSGPEQSKLELLAKELGISDWVVFLGWRDDVPSLMKTANVFLSTSQYEGYGMSLIEAGLCSCPIVSTDVGVAGDLLKDGANANICPVGDVDCFARKIIALMSDSALRDVFIGRMQSDIRDNLPSKEEYTIEYIKGLEDTLKNSIK
jgi:glycosyltransferase involved in cell wall biosynthesis